MALGELGTPAWSGCGLAAAFACGTRGLAGRMASSCASAANGKRTGGDSPLRRARPTLWEREMGPADGRAPGSEEHAPAAWKAAERREGAEKRGLTPFLLVGVDG